MQVKQSKGESSKPFISSVFWTAPAASRWLSPPASALLNINTHIYNNHSCSHTHTRNTAACMETEMAKPRFIRWCEVPLEAESPLLFLYSPDKACEAWMTYDCARWERCLHFTLGCYRSGCDMLAAAASWRLTLLHTVSSVRAMPTKYHAAQQELVHLNLTPEMRKMHQAKYWD